MKVVDDNKESGLEGNCRIKHCGNPDENDKTITVKIQL